MLERNENDSLRQQLKKSEERLVIQIRELETVRETIQEYKLQIVHI